MDPLILVTFLARVFIGLELVETASVAYLALDVLHKDVLCMAVRFPESRGALSYLV